MNDKKQHAVTFGIISIILTTLSLMPIFLYFVEIYEVVLILIPVFLVAGVIMAVLAMVCDPRHPLAIVALVYALFTTLAISVTVWFVVSLMHSCGPRGAGC